jgi:hypothetical protein
MSGSRTNVVEDGGPQSKSGCVWWGPQLVCMWMAVPRASLGMYDWSQSQFGMCMVGPRTNVVEDRGPQNKSGCVWWGPQPVCMCVVDYRISLCMDGSPQSLTGYVPRALESFRMWMLDPRAVWT